MIYKRGKYFSYKFQWNGQMLYFSTGLTNATAARKAESIKRASLAEGRAGIKRPEDIPTLHEYLERTILPWAEAQFVAVPASLKWYRNESRVLIEHAPLADARLHEINNTLVSGFKSWRQKQGRAIATINSSLRVLRATLSHAVEDGHINYAPKIRQLKGAAKRDYVLPPELEQKYLENCTQPLRDVAIIMLDAGLRPKEIYCLRWEDFRFDAKNPAIRVKGTKSAAAIRIVPMTPRVRDMLVGRWEAAGKPLHGFAFLAKRRADHIIDNTVMEPHWNAVRDSGINMKEFKLYCLRHTCLTRWGDRGMDAWSLAYLAGHSSIKQSMTYVHPTEASTARAFGSGNQLQPGDKTGDNPDASILIGAASLLVPSTPIKS